MIDPPEHAKTAHAQAAAMLFVVGCGADMLRTEGTLNKYEKIR